MTYLNNRHQSGSQHLSLFTPTSTSSGTLQTNEADFAALAPVFRGVVALGLSLLARFCGAFEDSLRYNCDHNTKKFNVAMLAMILFMCALKGTREEKTEFLWRMFEKLYAKRKAHMKELHAKYLVWRQRKCWAWGGGLGGGFMAGALAILPNVFVAARDEKSFDALIPDW